MATKGYMGFILTSILDITRDSERAFLAIGGSSNLAILSIDTIERDLERLLEDTSEEPIFREWYDRSLETEQ